MNLNKIKGDQYEIQIREQLIKNGSESYLWKDIPEKHLLKSNLVSSQEEIRLKRLRFKNNQKSH